ncbi:hypothetical protein D5S17_07025 [Pseudonocardiaceae bacterium YIM PH 21723]|nr:hypothetical protein D5S17_07025 [Pseudonocardiaceae bacterium YIM PH 21723]
MEPADRLAAELTPQRANDPRLAHARRNKALMQHAVATAGIPVIRTLLTGNAWELEAWLQAQDLTGRALVIKPPDSSGAQDVVFVPPNGDWRQGFERVLYSYRQPVMVQEFAPGTEYVVSTVSAAGQHTVAHIEEFTKFNLTRVDRTEFVHDVQPELVEYHNAVLDALGIRWGAAHSEIRLTPRGPRLIETSTRLCAGALPVLARAATGSSQLERLVQAYVDGVVSTGDYELRQCVSPVYMTAPHARVPVEAMELSTHLSSHPDLGMVALAGERSAVLEDHNRLRNLEKRLRIDTC